MSDQKLARIRAVLGKSGWVLPADATPLAQGGGGAVYKCYTAPLVLALSKHRNVQPEENGWAVDARLADQLVRATPETAFAALKVAHREDPRLVREVAAMQKVVDDHLVRVLVHDPSPNPNWFLMEFLDGGMLHAHLDRYRGNARKTLEAVLPIARALGKLHTAGLVHRDVKTKNVFLRANGSLVLGDLGIVLEDGAESVTTYESPKSADWTPRWKPADLRTAARDVYSLARVIYAMLTGDKIVEPHWLTDPDHSLASIFPDQQSPMAVADEFLQQHIVDRPDKCASRDGNAFADAIEETLRRISDNNISQTLLYWGTGHADPKSGKNRSLTNVPVLVPPWARRITARARFYHSALKEIGFAFELRTPKDASGLRTLLQSDAIRLSPGTWSNDVTLSLTRDQTGWNDLTVTGENSGLVCDFLLIALAY